MPENNDYLDTTAAVVEKVEDGSPEDAVRDAKVGKNHPDYIPTKEKWAYGVGALMDGGGVALMSCIMLKYMTSLGITAALAGTIMMIAKLWDAVSDPLMGFISDNTRSRFGRRKPYMFVGGILLIVGLFLLFAPVKSWGMSDGGFVAYILIMYLLWNTFSTITQVPYCSLASDISPNFRERNNANTVKLIFSSAAAGIAYVVPLLVLEAYVTPETSMFPAINGTEFWLIIAIVFGTLFGGGLIVTSIFVKERIQATGPREKFNFKKFIGNYAEPLRNKSFRWHIVMYSSAFMCMDMLSARIMPPTSGTENRSWIWNSPRCSSLRLSWSRRSSPSRSSGG